MSATVDEMRAAYEAKIDDLRRETLRSSTLAAVVRRLYHAYRVEVRGRYADATVAQFFADGFPPDEIRSLIAVVEADSPSDAAQLRAWAVGDVEVTQ